MSRIFSTNCGSVESLKASLRCGCSENAFQMRCTVEIDTPDAFAIERVLQCVAWAGIVSSVLVTTSAILSSPILRGAPGRGSSSRPSKRFPANRRRHVPTVSREIPSSSAIAQLLSPSAAKSTISVRIASARPILRRRTRCPSSSRVARRIVHDDVDVEFGRNIALDTVEKSAELLCAMARHTPADDSSGLHVQCCEERGRAVAFVVMGVSLGLAWAHRQQRLRAIQRLDLAFLVDTQHQSTLGRIEV